MTECNAIIEANKEIDRLKRENKKLNTVSVQYGFEMGRLEEENEQLKQFKDKVFALIDARIKIYKHKPFIAPLSEPLSVNFDEDTDRLARLSELEQLKKELN